LTDRSKPTAGPRYRSAAALPLPDGRRRRLLCLLAAWADAGEPSPPMSDLTRRLSSRPDQVDSALERLERAGLIRVTWANPRSSPPGRRGATRRNSYELGNWASHHLATRSAA